jgi:Bacterial CdiA-CT RNAse A domain
MLNTSDGSFEMKLQQMRCDLAALDVELKLCRLGYLLRKYSTDQPRAPAGSPEGGQWTSGGGGGGGEGDSEGDGEAQIELVQGEPSRGYSVDLEEEERRGGHAIEGHVAKSDASLKIEVQQMARDMVERDQYPLGLRVGSFTSLESATELVNSTLSQNRDRVDRVARGDAGGDFLRAFFASPTGYEAYLPTPDSLPYMRDTYGVGVLIARDPRAPNGFRVHTAYPIY